MGAHRAVRQAPAPVFIVPSLFPIGQSQQILLAGTNLKNLLDSVDKDLAIATVETGAQRGGNLYVSNRGEQACMTPTGL